MASGITSQDADRRAHNDPSSRLRNSQSGELNRAEERFKNLVEANSEQQRKSWALAWKERGGKVIGMLDYYVPEELVYAAGMFPWRVTGTWRGSISRALAYRYTNSCLFCTHVLESLLSGELDFLDGIIATDWDDDMRRLWDVFEHIDKPAFRPAVHVPRANTSVAIDFYAEDLKRLCQQLEKLSGNKVTNDALHQAIEVCNKTRVLLKRVYELRKREKPAISGTEALGLVLASTVMPKEEFNQELESLIGFVEQREARANSFHPRILLASDHLDHPAYIEVVEQSALVVMDDMDTGSRYFWNQVEEDAPPFVALSDSYLNKPACPRMFFWEKQVEQVIDWAREFRCDGVLNFPQTFSFDRLQQAPYFRDRLTEVGIPVLDLTRDYSPAKLGQLQTRIQAFTEMLKETV
ncbi:MAG: 2-hydroxyacyl-CoA dehydratase [Chloroflexi bacterium]|nr:2-hydroxyacyl-CoA dehydratase [Chloroflexota bacterium]